MNKEEIRKEFMEEKARHPDWNANLWADWWIERMACMNTETAYEIRQLKRKIETGTPDLEQQYWDRGHNSGIDEALSVLSK